MRYISLLDLIMYYNGHHTHLCLNQYARACTCSCGKQFSVLLKMQDYILFLEIFIKYDGNDTIMRQCVL